MRRKQGIVLRPSPRPAELAGLWVVGAEEGEPQDARDVGTADRSFGVTQAYGGCAGRN